MAPPTRSLPWPPPATQAPVSTHRHDIEVHNFNTPPQWCLPRPPPAPQALASTHRQAGRTQQATALFTDLYALILASQGPNCENAVGVARQLYELHDEEVGFSAPHHHPAPGGGVLHGAPAI